MLPPVVSVDCTACKAPKAMVPTKISKFSSVLVVIGWLIAIPSVLGVLMSGCMLVTTLMVGGKAVSDIGGTTKQGKSSSKPAPALTDDPIRIHMDSKKFEKGNFESGNIRDRVAFVFTFTNAGKKAAKAVKGTVILKDPFGDVVKRVGLKHEDGIAVGESKKWEGSVDYNQFKSEDSRLATIESKNLGVEWHSEQILFADGTSWENKEAPEPVRSDAASAAAVTGAAIGTGIGMAVAVFFGIASLIGGTVGYILIMKKKVFRCNQCGFIMDRH